MILIMLDLRLVDSFLDYSPLHLCPVGMQLHLVPLEGGAWFKKNHPWKK